MDDKKLPKFIACLFFAGLALALLVVVMNILDHDQTRREIKSELRALRHAVEQYHQGAK